MAARTRSLVERRRVLMAGVRSHTRFYKALAEEVREFHATKICGTLLTLLSGSLQGRSVFEATRVTLICEVDLGPRRPDCICVFEFANDKTLGGVCSTLGGNIPGLGGEAFCFLLKTTLLELICHLRLSLG